MTIESRELFELCSEVYKRTDWDNDGNLDSLHKDGGIYTKDAAWLYSRNYVPLYTSDYLLEKLPKSLTTIYGKAYPLSPQVMASGDLYYAMYKHDMTGPNSAETCFEVDADTPLKSLLKLTIALYEAGEL